MRRDLGCGQRPGPAVADGRAHDRATTGTEQPSPPGARRLADLGWFGLAALAAADTQGVWWRARGRKQHGRVDAWRAAKPWRIRLALDTATFACCLWGAGKAPHTLPIPGGL